MKRFAFAGLMLGALIAAPAQALEHRATIEHPDAGPIAADYRGSTRIVEKQIGSAGPGGRASTLRCMWSVSLTVERTALEGSGMQASRSMKQENALKGSAPGWCSSNSKAIQRIVDARRDSLRQTMMAMVAQDRAVILAEADSAKSRASAG